MAHSGVIAGQASGFDFLALLRETLVAALDSETAAQHEDQDIHEVTKMSDLIPSDPGSPGMPEPVELVCTGCGDTFKCDRTSEAARAETKLCPDCAFPELRGQ